MNRESVPAGVTMWCIWTEDVRARYTLRSYMTCADTVWNAVFLALPFWWRLMQCLKVFGDTHEVKNLYNACKYATAFPLVYAGYLRRHEPSSFHDQLFVVAAVVQSTYCLIWDVHMDWGLFRPQSNGLACCGAKPVNLFRLRDPLLVSQNRVVYIGICAGDLVLRFIWALSIFGGVPGRGFGMFFFEVVELARRTVWAVFRIEWEVIVKVHLPSGQDLMPLRAEISTLSEEEGEGT